MGIYKCNNCQNENTPKCYKCAKIYGDSSLENFFIPKIDEEYKKEEEPRFVMEIKKALNKDSKNILRFNDSVNFFDVKMKDDQHIIITLLFKNEQIIEFTVNNIVAKSLAGNIFNRISERILKGDYKNEEKISVKS